MTKQSKEKKFSSYKLIAIVALIVIVLVGASYAYLNMQSAQKQHLIVSTTTSLYETGLLDVLKIEFEKEYPSINVSFISQGTGLAIQTAMRGDADMILVHDPVRELKFMEDGYGVNRKVIAYNFFVVVGPSDDPANLKGLSPTEAFAKIKQAGESGSALWVSRGDDSGTHAKEKRIWQAAGFDTAELRTMDWYVEAGSGMTATLKLTDEKSAYTLCDMGSYLNNYANKNIELEVIVEAGKDTLNVYSAIANNPQKSEVAGSNFDASMKFIRFLASDEIQDIFADFGKDRFGRPLFNPYVKLLKSGGNQEMIQWIQELAYFDGTECPTQFRYKEGNFYQIILAAIFYMPAKPEVL
jgi:tungstate transport system substrate-binding protein